MYTIVPEPLGVIPKNLAFSMAGRRSGKIPSPCSYKMVSTILPKMSMGGDTDLKTTDRSGFTVGY